MVGIALPAYKRDLTDTLSPFLAQDVSDIKLYISLDLNGSNEVVDVEFLQRYYESFKEVSVKKTVVGLVNNTFNALKMAFDDGCDYVLYLEDDLEVSKDIVHIIRNLVDMARDTIHPPICFCNLESGNDPSRLIIKDEFIGWGFLIHRTVFEDIKNYWFQPPMWDLSIARYLNSKYKGFIFPEMSRIRHLGSFGTHIQSEQLNIDIQKNLKFYEGDKLPNYYIGINEDWNSNRCVLHE